MPETTEKLNKTEIEKQIKYLESDFALGNNLEENKKLYQSLFEQGHELTKQRAEKKLAEIKKIEEYKNKLEEIEKIKELQTKLGVTTEKTQETKEKESKIYSTEFIKDKISNLLLNVKEISEIKNLEVSGMGKEIIINTLIASGLFDIKVQATIENTEDSIAIKNNYKIDANWLAKRKVEKALIPNLGKVSELLKSYIEKEENKKVEKMQIENGQLKITFKK